MVYIMSNDYEELLKMWREEKKKRQEAEGELSIVKATTVHNSPEMRDTKKELEEVKNDNKRLALQVEDQKDLNKFHRKLNGELQTKLTESQKKECKCNTKT